MQSGLQNRLQLSRFIANTGNEFHHILLDITTEFSSSLPILYDQAHLISPIEVDLMSNRLPAKRDGMALDVVIVCVYSLHIAKHDQLTHQSNRLAAPWLDSCMALCSNG